MVETELTVITCPSCCYPAPCGSSFCPQCGGSVRPSGDPRAPHEVTVQWLAAIMAEAGYRVEPVGSCPESIRCMHRRRSNVVLTLRRELGLVAGRYWWALPPSDESAVLAAVNQANLRAWRQTFAVDAGGDLSVSFAFPLAERLSAEDVVRFVRRESQEFLHLIEASGLLRLPPPVSTSQIGQEPGLSRR
jgi:hypothetical protein